MKLSSIYFVVWILSLDSQRQTDVHYFDLTIINCKNIKTKIQPLLADILFHLPETLNKNLDRMNLTTGALAKICDGQEVADPVLQVLGHKPIQGSGQERSAEANTLG